MQVYENVRKTQHNFHLKKKNLETHNKKPLSCHMAIIQKIIKTLRQKEKSNNESKILKLIPSALYEKKDETCIPLFVIQSQYSEQKQIQSNITAKLLRLNKITQHKTEANQNQYNFIDKNISYLRKKSTIKSEDISPIRTKRHINGSQTDRKNIELEQYKPRTYHLKNQRIEKFIQINRQLYSGNSSPQLTNLNQSSFIKDRIKLVERTQIQSTQRIVEFGRQMSGWTIQSQDSAQTPQ